MRTEGRILTEKEAQQVRGHFRKNSGEHWDLATIGRYVREGAESIEKDPVTKKAIMDGLKSLRSG